MQIMKNGTTDIPTHGPTGRERFAGPSAPSAGVAGRIKPIPPKLYRIGELVEYSGMSRQTIHNYTTMGLLVECKWTDGGHRLYDEAVFERLNRIAELKVQGKSMEYLRAHFTRQEASEMVSSGP